MISLGADTCVGDPIPKFQLDTPEFLRTGAQLAGLGLPALFVMEGRYSVDETGANAAHALRGFRDAAG